MQRRSDHDTRLDRNPRHHPVLAPLPPTPPASPPLARAMAEALKLPKTLPPVVLTRALFTRTLRRHRQWHYLSAMYDDLHAWACGNKWLDSNQHSRNTISSPKSQKNVIFMGTQKMGLPNSTVSKVAEATPCVVLTRALFSKGGREGYVRSSTWSWLSGCHGVSST